MVAVGAVSVDEAAALLGASSKPTLQVIQGGLQDEQSLNPLEDLRRTLADEVAALRTQRRELSQGVEIQLKHEKTRVADARFNLRAGRLADSIVRITVDKTGEKPDFKETFERTRNTALLQVQRFADAQEARILAAEQAALQQVVDSTAALVKEVVESQGTSPTNNTVAKKVAFATVLKVQGDQLLSDQVLVALKRSILESHTNSTSDSSTSPDISNEALITKFIDLVNDKIKGLASSAASEPATAAQPSEPAT